MYECILVCGFEYDINEMLLESKHTTLSNIVYNYALLMPQKCPLMLITRR